MKKKFINPEIKVSVFFTENILTASGGGNAPATLKGDMEAQSISSIASADYSALQSLFGNN